MVEPGTVRTLSPVPHFQSWGTVTVKSGGKLILNAGSYNFVALRLEPDSSVLQLNGAVEIRIKTEFLYSGQPILQSNPRNPQIRYEGTAPIFLQKAFNGAIKAPLATVVVRDHFTGAIMASDIEVDAGETLTCAL